MVAVQVMLLATLISVSIWVSQDARKRGMSARWGIGVGLLLIVFLPLYFLGNSSGGQGRYGSREGAVV